MQAFALRTFALSLVLAAPVAALQITEQHSRSRAGQDTTMNSSDVALTRFTPQNANANELLNAMQRMYSRTIYVSDVTGDQPISNLFTIGDSLLIYDRPSYAQRVLDALTVLDAGSDAPQDERLQLFEYTPSHISLEAARDALTPFRRDLLITDPSRRTSMAVPNMSTVIERGQLVVRDTNENIQQMRDVLARLDVPQAQMLMRCWILRADPRAERTNAPLELIDNLMTLTGEPNFNLIASGMVRSAVTGGLPISLNMNAEGERFELMLVPSAHDADSGSISFSRCSFNHSSYITTAVSGGSTRSEWRTTEVFSASTDVRGGEYTVLGAAGANPTYVVLRAVPLP